MGWDPFHPGILDPQFRLEEGDLVFSAVDLSPQPDLTILTRAALASRAVKV